MKFAYGTFYHRITDTKCPAMSAGYEKHEIRNSMWAVSAAYDRILWKEYDPIGAVDEDDAKAAWLQAIEDVEDTSESADAEADVAKDVARELGWME